MAQAIERYGEERVSHAIERGLRVWADVGRYLVDALASEGDQAAIAFPGALEPELGEPRLTRQGETH